MTKKNVYGEIQMQSNAMFSSGKKIATKNKTGAMVTNISDISKKFIMDSKTLSTEETVVDIGCCYGVATLAILEQCSCKIIGIDASNEHLKILKTFVAKKDNPRLTLINGYFPKDFIAENNSISKIHASHLLQFLTGNDIENGMIKCYKALHPNGKLYITTTSIHLPWIQAFLPIYKDREANGEKWPGEIHNFVDYAPTEAKDHVQNFFHVLTKDRLKSLLEKIGFTIKESFYYDVNNPQSHAEEGKEMIGIIAEK